VGDDPEGRWPGNKRETIFDMAWAWPGSGGGTIGGIWGQAINGGYSSNFEKLSPFCVPGS